MEVYDGVEREAQAVGDVGSRTNIELDDELLDRAMRMYGTRTKRETVDLALRRLVGGGLGTEDALALEGSGWDGDLDQFREDTPPAGV